MKFGRNIQNTLEQFAYFSFSVEFVFLSIFRLSKPDTENNANFDACRSSKCANFDEVQFF